MADTTEGESPNYTAGGSREAGIEALKGAMGLSDDQLDSDLEESTGEPREAEEDPVDVSSLARELTEEGYENPDAWRGPAKARLVELGYNEKVAHELAYQSKREIVEKTIDAVSGKVQSPASQSESAPKGSEDTGPMLSEELERLLEDGEAEPKQVYQALEKRFEGRLEQMQREMDEKVRFLQSRTAGQESGELAKELQSEYESLVEQYPELRNRANYESLAPKVKALATGDRSAAAALRLAAIEAYGLRTGDGADTNPSDPPLAPQRSGQESAPVRGNSSANLKARLDRAIFGSRPEADVQKLSREYERALKEGR